MNFIARICLVTIAIVSITGCDNGGPTQSHNATEVTEDSDDHGHDHGHDHGSEGPHGGHILGLGDEEFHLEWIHNEAGKLTFYLLDDAAKADVSTAANSIAITTTVKDETTTVTLNTTTPDADEHNKFEVIDPVLLQRLELVGHGVTASASVQIADKQYTGEFEHHDHGHGHSH